MAGISDRPFRELCKQFGAGLTVSEMVASNPALRKHKRTLLKADHNGETGLRSVQILGTDPQQMADAARFNAQQGAHIIDINMGCPAKKVCSVAAGSALLRD
jgi:tRNA-dihydrouridine synthase B